MRRIFALTLLALLGSCAASPAQAQSGCVYIATGAVLTAAQWQSCWSKKQDVLGFTPVNKAGDVMLGPLVTTASTTLIAGFNVPQGAAPTSPQNGDMWTTTAGLFYRANGLTVGPLVGGGNFALTNAHLFVGNGSNVAVDVALTGDCSIANTGAITCTKTSGSSFAPVATSGSAADLSAGTLLAARMPALTGDVTSSAGSVATTVAANAVTNAKAAQMASLRTKCNPTTSTANSQDCTPQQISSISQIGSILDGTYNESANRTLNPDCTWQGQFHVAQPAVAFIWLYQLPSILSIQSASGCQGGRLSFSLQSNTPGAGPAFDGTKICFQAFFTAQNTNASTAIANNVLHFASNNPAWIIGMPVYATHPGIAANTTVTNIAGGDVTISNNVATLAVGSGVEIQIGGDTIDGNPTIRGVNETNLTFCLHGDEAVTIESDLVGVSTTDWKLRTQGPHYNQSIYNPQSTANTTTASATFTALSGFTMQLPQMLQTCSSRETPEAEFSIGSSSANDFAACTFSQGGVGTFTITTPGSGYVNGNYCNVLLTTSTGVGKGVQVNVTTAGAAVTAVTYSAVGTCSAITTAQPARGGKNYAVNDTLSAPAKELGGTGSGLVVTVATLLKVDTTTNGLATIGPLIGAGTPTPSLMRLKYREPGQCQNGTLVPSVWTVLCRSAAAATLSYGTVNGNTSTVLLDSVEFGVK